MTAYLIANLHKVTDPETYQDYLGEVGPTIAKFGGKPLVSCPNIGIYEGSWSGNQILIVEFPNRQAVDDWYNSEDYAPLMEMRKRSLVADVIVIDND